MAVLFTFVNGIHWQDRHLLSNNYVLSETSRRFIRYWKLLANRLKELRFPADVPLRISCKNVEAHSPLGHQVCLQKTRSSPLAHTEYFFVVSLTTAADAGRPGVCGLSMQLSYRSQVHDKETRCIVNGKLIKLGNWEPDGREAVSCCCLYFCSHKIEPVDQVVIRAVRHVGIMLPVFPACSFRWVQCGFTWKITERCETTCERNEIFVEKGKMEIDKIRKMIYPHKIRGRYISWGRCRDAMES